MKTLRTFLPQLAAVLGCAALAAASAKADTVDTKSGAHLVGKITKIDDDTVYLHTDYAGDLSIKQSEVTHFTTDEVVSVRLESGTRLAGKVEIGRAHV